MKHNTRSNRFKRIASIITALVMVSTIMPVNELSIFTKYIFNEIIAFAEEMTENSSDENTEEPTEPSSEPFTEAENEETEIESVTENAVLLQEGETGFTVDDTNRKFVISSLAGLVNYSVFANNNWAAYYEYDIELAITDSSANLNDFQSIGTEEHPFSGKIIYTSKTTIPLDNKPLFNAVSDKCSIADADGNPAELNIKCTANMSGAIFANKVVASGDQTVPNEWKISIADDTYKFLGIIGTIGENAKVSLIINNNANHLEFAEISAASNTGLVCGTMGSNAQLAVSYTMSSECKLTSITSTDGNAGGLVGEMMTGSELVLNSNMDFSKFTIIASDSANGCAGGLVGKATDATIVFNKNAEGVYYKVTANVNGKKATGGVFGCYVNSTNDRTFTNFKTDCDVIGNNAGGVFGELQNNMSEGQASSITFDQTNNVTTKRTSSSADTAHYGGLIGLYTASDSACALNIVGTDTEKLNVTVSKTGTSANYGGIIGATEKCSYVNCSDVNVTAAGCNTKVTAFGGVIGKAGSGKIDVNNFTVSTDENFLGGGVIGDMGNGSVLQLSGTTDLSDTLCSDGGNGNYGQIVGLRGNQTLVYALYEWKLIRSTTPVRADDLGTWGEVLRFNNVNFKKEEVLTVNNDNTVTVNNIAVTDNDNKVTVSSLADFAKVALILKCKSEKNDNSKEYALKFESIDSLMNTANNNNNKITLTITADIDLRGTGLTGLYRDDGISAAGGSGVFNFKGSIKGEENTIPTITMSVGEPYGYRKDSTGTQQKIELNDKTAGNGRIYRHRYAGLVTKICGQATFSNVKIAGNIWVEPRRAVGGSEMFIGSFAAQNVVSDNVEFTNIETTVVMDLGTSDSSITNKCGGLVGEFYGDCKVELTYSEISPSITFNNDKDSTIIYAGGVLGNILDKELAINTSNTNIKAKIENTGTKKNANTAGFIANINGLTRDSRDRTICFDNVTLENVEITGSNNAALLGSMWNDVDVTFGGDKGGLSVTNCELGGGNIYAGLITQGSGYWQVNKIDINGITVNGGEADSFGMFVNYTDTSGIKSLYLEFTNKDAYKISGDKLTLNSVNYFDEILVFAHKDKKAGKAVNGSCSVVSIHTEDNGVPTVIMDGENCNTYSNQTTFLSENSDKINNPYVRYYYNLDTIRAKNDNERNAQEKLLLWSVGRYAHDSLKKYFSVESFIDKTDESGKTFKIPSGTYDMKGYSYYPIDIADNVTIGGDTETIIKFYNSEFDTSEGKGGKRLTTDIKTQHYQMQSGLFRNFKGCVTMNNVSLGGNVGKVVSNNAQSGAIINGIMSGSNDSPAELICKDITLDGIVVNGADSNSNKVPLLIFEVNKNSKLTINGLKTSNKYNTGDTTKIAAGSLIGNIGDKDSNNPDNIKVVFNRIVLDSRKNRFGKTETDTAFDTAYNTKNSIFSQATLVNSYFYPKGNNCSAVYNYRYEEDWDSAGNPLHQVTYGNEITYSKEYWDTVNDVSLERNYLNSEYFTNPENALSANEYNFNTDNFLPYVKDYSKSYGGYTTHEIKVNIPSPNFDVGCGTYNDPYIISNAKQLDMLSDFGFADGTIINYHDDNYKSWCSGHITYIKEGDFFYPVKEDSDIPEADTGKDGFTDKEMQSLLSTAYYKINGDITLKDTFKSIGKEMPFMGVIDGNNKTITNENTVPFIYNSKGSVVKDLNLVVKHAFTVSESGDSKYEKDGDGTCPFYGGLIGIVNGGDNIIDNVGISFEKASEISITSTDNPGNIAIGGYIGVVRYGGVVFRNMENVTSRSGLAADKNALFYQGAETNGYMDFKGTDEKVYLYCNPIIGRVIDGYAVTETSEYKTNSVTMDNGTKNYSIADINKSSNAKLTFEEIADVEYKVTVPDSQSLFLMGCITNSGGGKYDSTTGTYPASDQLFGYGNGQMVRHGNYSDIGNSAGSTDFTDNVKSGDLYSGNIIPYLVYKYTESGTDNSYPARTLTGSAVFDIEFTNNGYELPQGFRGIGTLNDTQGELTAENIGTIAEINEFSQMKLRNITGNNAIITLSTSYYSYSDAYDKYTRNFVTGLGLFGTLLQNYNGTTGGVIENLTIKGSIKADKFTDSGSAVYDNDCFHIGGLAGTAFGNGASSINLNNVNVQNLTIDSRSSHAAGGLIGYLRSNNSESSFKAENCGASTVTVNSYKHAGGLVGYAYDYSVTVGNDTDTIKISNVSPKVIGIVAAWENVLNSAGCVIGGTYNKSHTFKNIAIDGGTITANGKNTAAGSLIGCANDIKENGVTDTYHYNISGITVNSVEIVTESKDAVYNGGLIGALKSFISADCTISDCHIVGKAEKSQINGTSIAGGLIGVDCQNTTIDRCSVENYIISTTIYNSNPCGGLIGKVERNNTILKNSYIKDCTIQYSGTGAKNIGGIAGFVNDSITFSGYNVAVKNVSIVSQDTTNVGTAIGGVNSTAGVKFVGVSISCVTGAESVFGSPKGKDSYVICSDMNGTCRDDSPNKNYSEVNYDVSTHVSDYGCVPYATINPKTMIDNSMFLTGDGVSTEVQDILKSDKNLENYKSKLSTFGTEMGLSDVTNDFPVLIVNESDPRNITRMINQYIKVITNSDEDINYAKPDADRFEVSLTPYKYENGTFSKGNAQDQSLVCLSEQFRMNGDNYDNKLNQFTLLDIQYKDPSGSGKIVYHLYIPLMVEKMLKYDFTAKILSGTTYSSSAYTNAIVLENYGTPVTAYIKFSYKRTVGEWLDAVNAGENILKSYGKTVLFKKNSTGSLSENTDIVLVDCNNNDKVYYSKLKDHYSGSEKPLIKLDNFKSSDNKSFSSVSLYDVLSKSADITATVDENGKFIEVQNEQDATVKTTKESPRYFRLKKPEDSSDEILYNISITGKSGSGDAVTVEESYYLSVFTSSSENTTLSNVEIMADSTLDDTGFTTPSHVNKNTSAAMLLGDVYEQTFSFRTRNTDFEMRNDNTKIDAEMNTVIKIKESEAATIKSYLQNEEIKIFHGFVIGMNITDGLNNSSGVKGNPRISASYSVNDKTSDIQYYCSDSVIVISNDNDTGNTIRQQLIKGDVKISCTVLSIDYIESAGIMEQFPVRPEENNTNGVKLTASSNIAYLSDNISNSNIYAISDDKNNGIFYRQEDIKIASLNYNIPSGTTDADRFSSLGVNGRVSEEHINASGYYDVSDISEDALTTANRISVRLELQRKNNDGQYDMVPVRDHLSNITINGVKAENAYYKEDYIAVDYDASQTDIHKRKLFIIDTAFDVVTGKEFEDRGHIYSNYRVVMKVSLYKDDEMISNSSAEDYIVYTNAKIFTELVPVKNS